MFKKNVSHLQPDLFGFHYQLPEKMRQKIEESEEYLFYKLIYCNIREEDFACLYSEKGSRPNAPINAMVASLFLIHRRGWTYEELFEHIEFNLLTKTALGLSRIDEIPFCNASLFNFLNRLNTHFIKTGETLLEKVFDGLTKSQLKSLKIKTNIQRTDSFFAASNIRTYTRLQLLIELVLRIYRILSEEDKQRFAERFSHYLGKSSGKYIYHLKADDFPHELEKIAEVYSWIESHLKPHYCDRDIFNTFERVLAEHFVLSEECIEMKPNNQLNSSSLQSPDDLDATYRKKGDKQSRGQKINIVETAHPENELNLITDVTVAANNVDDSQLLDQRLEALKEKTPDLDEIHFDGAFGSETVDHKLEKYGITGIQTAIKGVTAAVPLTIEQLSDECYQVQCPLQSVISTPTRTRHKADFDPLICNECPFSEKCSTTQGRKKRTLYFTHKEYLSKKRQKALYMIPEERRTLRMNIEASVREFTCKMPQGKLKVRGAFKTAVFAFSTAAAVNFGRIYRYLRENPDMLEKWLSSALLYVKEQCKFRFIEFSDRFNVFLYRYFTQNTFKVAYFSEYSKMTF